MKHYKVLGMMSGTSLDGLDLALCTFTFEQQWSFCIEAATTIAYTDAWRKRLQDAQHASAIAFCELDQAYGRWLGEQALRFLDQHAPGETVLIASHGHTIFHNPAAQYTVQIGHAAAIHALTNMPVTADFRVLDVHLGGQGAPLVPVGDALLFPEYAACINLGGFANYSIPGTQALARIAADICPFNLVMNTLAQKMGKLYDEDGAMAASGTVQPALLTALNALPYYRQKAPKSLGREWVETTIWPLLQFYGGTVPDQLATYMEHALIQIETVLPPEGAVLFTGGGAKNKLFQQKITAKLGKNAVFPADVLIDQKEALIFALLGLLRALHKPNVWPSVTGSSRYQIAGSLWGSY